MTQMDYGESDAFVDARVAAVADITQAFAVPEHILKYGPEEERERELNEQQNRLAFRNAQIEMEIHAALFALRYRGLRPPPLTERQRWGAGRERWVYSTRNL